ncbi:MAG: primosomal protein N' [Candidatus Omnitrophota bacterium]
MKYAVAQVTVGLPVEGPFDYSIPESLSQGISVGKRVVVSFGKTKRVGFIVGLSQKSKFKFLKPILSLLDVTPLLGPSHLLLAKQMAEYYFCSWGEAIELSLPVALRKPKPTEMIGGENPPVVSKEKEIILLRGQDQNKTWAFVLENIQKTLLNKKGIILLVPENWLLDDAVRVLKENLTEEIVVLDRASTPKAELEKWTKIKEGKVKVAVGVRSTIFAPVVNLGLIVIMDENNAAYKQDQSPFYHVSQIAFMRSDIENADILFVSRVPSVEMLYQASKEKIRFVDLSAQNLPLTPVQVVDMSAFNPRKTSLISFPLRAAIEKILSKKGKTVLFMNRKGFSTLIRCTKCGYTMKCRRCDTHLTYLFEEKKMICRYCQFTAAAPTICPSCNTSYLRYSGMGIEKLESEIARLFPGSKVAHFDKESAIFPQDFDILIATQAVLKMHDALSVDLIGIMQLDAELNRADFRSGQKTFALLMDFRHMAKEKLIVQTHVPDNYCLQAALKSDFDKFYKEEIKFRKELKFPPLFCFVSVGLRAVKEEIAREQIQIFHELLNEHNKGKQVEILDPQPDFIPRLRGKYRFTILLKSKSHKKMRLVLQKALKSFKRKKDVNISINVDS